MNKFLRIGFYFIFFYLLLSLLGIGQAPTEYKDDVVILAENEYSFGANVQIKVLNNSEENLEIANDCQKTPLLIQKYNNGQWTEVSAKRETPNCQNPLIIAPKTQILFDYSPELFELFKDMGQYRVIVKKADQEFIHTFEIVEPGIFKKAWLVLIFQPIYNLLIWIVSVLPNHSLGWGIILLTILVRLALLAPNQKALKSQKSMQSIQPKLEAVKKKYAGNQQKIAEETMKIWKEGNVNPLGSCLPILIQFPVMIAVFIVLKAGLTANNSYYLYDVFKNFDYSLIQTTFATIDLAQAGPWFLAIIIATLQFFQMKMSLSKTTNKNADQNDMMAMQMQIMNKSFQYVMPVMIGVFTLSLPAGVGIYWGVSTLFGLIQQKLVYSKN